MFDTISTCLPRFLITEYFSVEKMQNRFPFVVSYLPLPEQYLGCFREEQGGTMRLVEKRNKQ